MTPGSEKMGVCGCKEDAKSRIGDAHGVYFTVEKNLTW